MGSCFDEGCGLVDKKLKDKAQARAPIKRLPGEFDALLTNQIKIYSTTRSVSLSHFVTCCYVVPVVVY